MDEDFEDNSSDFRVNAIKETEPQEIDVAEHSDEASKCRCLYVMGYLGVFYFVIMAIIYILIQYALIRKFEQQLICDQVTLTCNGTINHVDIKDQVYFQLASSCPNYQVQYPVGIVGVILVNSTNYITLGIVQDEEPNCYFYYRHLWAFDSVNLIYSYNISFKFKDSIPAPFFNNLRVIMRQAGLFDQDQTINQAIMSLLFAACIAVFNITSKFTENHVKIKSPGAQQKVVHKISGQTPKDIQQIDENLKSLRELALLWMMKRNKKSFDFNESDSEFSILQSP